MARVNIEFLFNRDLNTPEEYELLFAVWQKYFPHLIPQKYGTPRPRHVFDIQRPTEPFQTCRDRVNSGDLIHFYKTKMPKVDFFIAGRIPGYPANTHSIWKINLDSTDATSESILAFLAAGSVQLGANFAYAQVGNQYDLARGKKSFSILPESKNIWSIYLGAKVHEYLPDLYWCSIFGPPYVQFFGEQHLLHTPAYAVMPPARDMILVQLTDQITDSISEPSKFEEVRREAKDHLNHNAFFDIDRVKSKTDLQSFLDSMNNVQTREYDTPEFVFHSGRHQ